MNPCGDKRNEKLIASQLNFFISYYLQKPAFDVCKTKKPVVRLAFHSFKRRVRDSNPRYLSVQRFSRPPQSTTLPTLRDKSSNTLAFGK